MLGALVAGTAWLVTSPWLPLNALPGLDRFRIYNVAGRTPRLEPYRLRVRAAGGREQDFDLAALRRLPRAEITADFHCVTGWSVDSVAWAGARIRDVISAAVGDERAGWVHFHSADGVYSDSLPWHVAVRDDVAVVWTMEGDPLPRRHGGPARLLAAPLYGYKSVKWLDRIELSDQELVGYWEQRGYAGDAFVDKPRPPRLDDPVTRRFPQAGVVLRVPRGWTLTDGAPGAITVVTVTPDGEPDASLVVYDYRVSARATTGGLLEFALSGFYFGAARATRSPLEVDGRDAIRFDYTDDQGRRARDVFIANDRQILLVAARSAPAGWPRLEPEVEAVVAALRLGRPREAS
jgi:hypothetical protein